MPPHTHARTHSPGPPPSPVLHGVVGQGGGVGLEQTQPEAGARLRGQVASRQLLAWAAEGGGGEERGMERVEEERVEERVEGVGDEGVGGGWRRGWRGGWAGR